MKRLTPFRPLVLPAVLIAIFIVLAFNYRILDDFDEWLTHLIRQIPADAEPFMQRITILGNFYEDIVIIILIAAWQLIRKHYNRAFVSVLTLSAFPLFFLVKETVTRARPTGEFIIAHGLPGYSFPSGHAVTSAAAFGLLAVMMFSHLRWPWRMLAFGSCLLLIVTIGVSRVYLGAHYPTDVIAGWLLALAVLSTIRGVSIYIASRTTRSIHDTTENPDTAA